MKRFTIGFVLGLLFAGLVVVILAVAAMRLGGERRVTVADGSALVLHLEGDLPEQPPVELPIPFLEQQQPLAMIETWDLLRRAAADPRVKALVVEPRGLGVGWAKLEELHDEILAFKKSGKPVYAYLRSAGTREYYVAMAADRVFMSPEDELDVKGLRAQLMFVKGTLDKLGVELEFEHVGKYKDAPDMFTRTTPTPETLEVINQILDQYFGDILQTIAQGRKKPASVVRELIDDGPFVGKTTLADGLVDALVYEDEMYEQLKAQLKQPEIKRIDEHSYARAPRTTPEAGARIAFVVGQGDITRGSTHESDSGDGITSTGMVKVLRQVENDSSVKGVILRIDSPGGDGIASDEILHEAKALSKKKPMIISMSDLAASGGYFIAMTGDPILAYPNTETGSIGVFFGKVNVKGLLDKVGVTETALTRGRFAGIDAMDAPLSGPERDKLRKEIEVFYTDFVQRVAEGRKRNYDQVEPLAQGRVWLGAQAKQNGLVDELGGLDRAVEMIKARANIGASQSVTLVTYPPRRTLLDLVWNRSDDSAELDAALRASLIRSAVLPANLREFMGKVPVRALLQGGILRLMPFTLDVK
jgi:protease IV